jgi:hypothetical protein
MNVFFGLVWIYPDNLGVIRRGKTRGLSKERVCVAGDDSRLEGITRTHRNTQTFGKNQIRDYLYRLIDTYDGCFNTSDILGSLA